MDVTNTTQKTPLSPSSTTQAEQSQAAAVLSSDFETFLQMLTAQARYQDPLEPIDSSEYAAQLAQFSMVEQQVLSNDLLNLLSDQLGAGQLAQMAGWIGLEARTTAPAPFAGQPMTIIPATEAGADDAVLVVYNEAGEVAARRQIPLGSAPVEWDGKTAAGVTLQPGNYSFSVESRVAGTVIATTPAETYAPISEARRDGGETVFVLEGGSEVRSDQINALRDPV